MSQCSSVEWSLGHGALPGLWSDLAFVPSRAVWALRHHCTAHRVNVLGVNTEDILEPDDERPADNSLPCVQYTHLVQFLFSTGVGRWHTQSHRWLDALYAWPGGHTCV